jgi:recombination protein RecT
MTTQNQAQHDSQIDYETGEYTPAPADPRDLEMMAQDMAQSAPVPQRGAPRGTSLIAQVEQFKGEFAKVLPPQVTIDKFIRVSTTAIRQNPDLSLCNEKSVFQALLLCARDGLLPDGRESAIVIYNSKSGKNAQYQVMIDGVLKKVRQSGLITNVAGKAVFENDTFDYFMDENGEHITYKPTFENPGKFRLAFAFAKYKTGELVVEVMSKTEIDKVRASSKTGNGAMSPWTTWYDRMAVKSVLHRLARRLPNSSEVAEMLERDIQFEAFQNQIENAKASASQFAPKKPRPL